ncbi:MAG: gamma-glutamyltransferase family protein [Gammaproteobacteria bacterium]|nr:gamma-glutamyltransferase family protein [Gammaproteobacteria bacterium]
MPPPPATPPSGSTERKQHKREPPMPVVPPTLGHNFVVSAGHELAALAAFEILDNGGNAVDAGVAAILTLGVVYSDQVSIAGVAPMIIHWAQTGETLTVTGLGGWPAALDVDEYIRRHRGEIPLGVRRTVVPAAPDACIQALRRWGTMRFADVAARAIRHAAAGFARHHVMIDYVAQYADAYRHFPDNVELWLPGGVVPRIGQQFIQADLGRTLSYLCDQEKAAGPDRDTGLAAVHHAFYQGDLASTIVKHQQEHDGLLSAADLAGFASEIIPSVARTVRLGGEDIEIHTCGAWCQGPVLHTALNIAAGLDFDALGYGTGDYFHHIAETLKLVFADREAYLGDPAWVDVPLSAWLSQDYGQAQRARITGQAFPGLPVPAKIPGYTPYISPVAVRGEPAKLPADTSIVAIIDKAGNAFCANPSDTSWDTPIVPGTGLAISSRGHQSWAVKEHPSCLAPGKRPRLTPNPCFARSPGRWLMPFGTPGGDTQVQANLQFLLNHFQFAMPLQDAIEAPRLMTHSHPDSFAPHEASPGRVTIEGRVAEAVCDELQDKGHQVERLAQWTHAVAGLCAVKKDLHTGAISGAADPRRTSRSMGW